MDIIPYYLYLTTPQTYTKDIVLACKEDHLGQLVLNASSQDVEKSQKSIFVRGLYAKIRNGYVTLYRKLNKDLLVENLTEYYTRKNAVLRIERYWQQYSKRRQAINVIKPYIVHWAYKPDGVLGKRIIAKLSKIEN